MRIRDLREDNDLTQKEIAEYLHIRQNTYSQYETGVISVYKYLLPESISITETG